MAAEVTVTSENFKSEVLESSVPVLADFWAEWCMPCKMVAPILSEIAEAYDGKLKVAKINVDQAGDIAGEHNIVSIPTLLVFKDGEVVDQQVGAVPRKTIEQMIEKFV